MPPTAEGDSWAEKNDLPPMIRQGRKDRYQVSKQKLTE